MQNSRSDVTTIEIPFEHRHHCWFCGEPSHVTFNFPPLNKPFPTSYGAHHFVVLDCPHPSLQVPCCAECLSLAQKAEVKSIWAVNEEVKRNLLKRYRKDLAIGINWTKEELANSGFEGGTFEGFQRSAWFMFEVAKGRVSFESWKIVYQGIDLVNSNEESMFVFDGVSYPSLHDAVEHYANVFKLNRDFFQTVVNKVGSDRFSFAIRFCRILVGSTPIEQKRSLQDLE